MMKPILSILTIITISMTQSAFACLHPLHHLAFAERHPLRNIPKIPASENNSPEIRKQLKTIGNLYRIDNNIVDHYPGPLQRMAVRKMREQQLQKKANSTTTVSDQSN